jgi:hypothetical protein
MQPLERGLASAVAQGDSIAIHRNLHSDVTTWRRGKTIQAEARNNRAESDQADWTRRFHAINSQIMSTSVGRQEFPALKLGQGQKCGHISCGKN